MLVKEVMLKNVLTVKRSTTLSNLLKIYGKFHGHPLVPVVDETNGLVGQVSLDDILGVFSPHSREMEQLIKSLPFVESEKEDIFASDIPPEMGLLLVVDDFMDKKVVTINENLTIEDTYWFLEKNSLEEVLVTDSYNRVVGIAGLFDIILAVFRQKGVV